MSLASRSSSSAGAETVFEPAKPIAPTKEKKGAAQAPKWVKVLRDAVKQEHGFGWSLRDKNGKVQLTRRFEDGTRSAVVLDLPWNSGSTSEVLGLLPEIRSRMESQRLGLAEAYDLLRGPNGGRAERMDWELAVSRFERHKTSDTGEAKASTYQRMYAPVMGQVLEAMAAKPVPRDGRALLASLRDRCGGEPGSRGRKLRMQYTAALLRYAVTELGAAERWLPPNDLTPFIGKPSQTTQRQGSTPLKDHQLVRLLEGIPDPRWRLAVTLAGCFGLRPVELGHCRANGDKLLVTYQKRTARGSTKPGDVVGLDPEGLDGESLRALRLLESGLVELPPMGTSDGDAAVSMRQYLERREVWRSLKAEISSKGEKLTVYGLRHGYALRAHQRYGLSPRVTATLMRHSLQTHCQHYGSWTDTDVVEKAVQEGINRLTCKSA